VEKPLFSTPLDLEPLPLCFPLALSFVAAGRVKVSLTQNNTLAFFFRRSSPRRSLEENLTDRSFRLQL